MAARNALAKSLRAGGDRDGAALVAALRRPSWTDWALNRAAEIEPDAAVAFADAADAMRDAQTAAVEGRAADVQGAMRALRERIARLAKLATGELVGAGRPPSIAEATERLAAAAAHPTETALVRTGVLRSDADDDEAIAGLPDAGAISPRRAHRATRADPATPPASDRPEPTRDDEATERAAERRRLMRAIADAERAQRSTAHELDRAGRAVADGESRRASAAAALAKAKDELADADRRLALAAERQHDLARDSADADARLRELRTELDRLASG